MVFGILGMGQPPVNACEKPTPASSGDSKSTTNDYESLECSYENCTPLFRRIERGDWGDVMCFLDTGYWPGDFFKDPISPTEQAKTWVYRFHDKEDDEGKRRLRWSQLPLHLSLVVKAPFPIIQKLLEINPDSVRCTDDQKMLPLHLAMRYGASDRVVELVLSTFPDAVHVKAKGDRTPLDCAMRANVLRGHILSTFVKGMNAKTTDEYVAECTQEITELREKLKGKEEELGSVRCQLNGFGSIAGVPVQHVQVINAKTSKMEPTLFVGTEKSKVNHDENDHSTWTTREHGIETDNFAYAPEQTCSLDNSTFTQEQASAGETISSQNNAKLTKREDTQAIKYDFKIVAKDSYSTDGGSIERILTEDQVSTNMPAAMMPLGYCQEQDYKDSKLPLEYFQEEYKEDMISFMASPSLMELRSLQEQAMTMTETGIQEFLEGAEAKIEALTSQLASEVQKSDAATREEIRIMQRMIEELKLTAEASAVTAASSKIPNEEVGALKLEIEALRKELKESILEIVKSRSNAGDSVCNKRRSKVVKKGKGRRPPFASILRASESRDSVGSKTVLTTDSHSKAIAGSSAHKAVARKMNWFSLKKPAGRGKQVPAQSGPSRQVDLITALRSDFESLRKQLCDMQRVPQVPVLTNAQSAVPRPQKEGVVKSPPAMEPVTDETAALRMELNALRDLLVKPNSALYEV